ncbi:unnamed protein product [Caenorhabditis bovis]|uniref:Uncharacterized protein n=1 Tax=Caenorhabditis bovis TaxID=2654633 RepID=A0A8S1F3S1_9PELO|nr:unnamed protein product [Caenorhabditis bovis]
MLPFFIKIFLIFAFFANNGYSNWIGKCDLSAPPASWLSTNATGIIDWATAGQPTNGSHFCLEGNRQLKTFHNAYQIDLCHNQLEVVSRNVRDASSCQSQSSRIVYCFSLCFNNTMEDAVVQAALKSNIPQIVANDIQTTLETDWAITVMQVDYNDPATHLNISSFLDPNVWCSVYIGIKPKLGFDYLFEIQLGKIIH